MNEQADDKRTESDRAALDYAKSELEESNHRRWLWSLFKRGSAWVLGIVGFFSVVTEGAVKLWRYFSGSIP